MKRAFIFVLSFALTFSSFFPYIASAESAEPVKVSSDVIRVLSDVVIYSEDDEIKELGKVVRGATLLAEEVENGRVYIQWNEDLVYISEEKVEFIDGETEDDLFPDNIETNGSLIVLEESKVRIPQGDVLATLSKGIEYSFIDSNENGYEILLGNRIGYVDRSNVEEISQDEEPPNEDTDGNPQNNNGESEESIDQDTPQEEAIEENDNSTQHDESVIDDSVEEGTNVDGQAGLDNESKADYFSIQSGEIPFGKYFKVIEDSLTVYDNSTGSLVPIGTLEKGQIYPRVSDYGNWHRIQFGSRYGYVWKESTQPADGKGIKNLNKNYKNSARSFKALVDLTVYDNTSGKLVPFATIKKGQQHPVVSDYGNWYRVDVSGRIGYVNKSGVEIGFTKNDRYFQVTEDDLTVYDNRSGKLKPIGTLEKGQVYPRVSDYGNWHRIQFGNRYGYVWKESTQPASGSGIKNLNNNRYKNTSYRLRTITDVTVYDNSSGKLIPFAVINKSQDHPVISDYGNWYRIDISGRIGYVNKSGVKVDFLKNTRYFRVTEDNLTVYDNSTGKLISIGTLVKGQEYPRLRDYGNWHEIKFGNSTGYVWKESTEPAINHSLKNVELGDRTNIGIVKTTRSSVAVYDNTGKSLVPFMYINKDVEISYIRDYGNWWEVHIANRIGYIGKTNVKFVRHLIRDVVNPKQNYSYNEMQRDIQTLKQMYPDLIQTQIIGKSVDGRNIYALKLGKGKTEIFFHGSHHAREHITTNLLMEMIDEYAQAYVKGNKIDGYNVKTVLDRTSIWFVPMVNPDGVMLVQEGASSAKNSDYVLKLNNYNRNFRAWKANIRGVDLNRQYPADWENIKNNTGKPAPMNYKGKRPLTEPEVRAVYNFTRSHDFKTAVAYHSTGEIIYWNFHQKGAIYARDHRIAKMVGNKTGYSLVYPGPNPSGGGYTDWFILSQKKPGLTIEVSPWLNNRPVPISYFDRIWKQNYSVGLLLANEAYVNRNKR